MRLVLPIMLSLVAVPAAAQGLNVLLHGSYAPEGQCGGEQVVLVGPWGVNLRTAEEERMIAAWDECATCKATAEQPGLLLIAAPRTGDPAPDLLFEAGNGNLILRFDTTDVDGELSPLMRQMADAGPYERCIDAP